MYIYTMERTQIYLTRREREALARAARETGRTRSQLIREAIEARYLGGNDGGLLQALAATAGIWSDRTEAGEDYVERIRRGRLRRLHRDR